MTRVFKYGRIFRTKISAEISCDWHNKFFTALLTSLFFLVFYNIPNSNDAILSKTVAKPVHIVQRAQGNSWHDRGMRGLGIMFYGRQKMSGLL